MAEGYTRDMSDEPRKSGTVKPEEKKEEKVVVGTVAQLTKKKEEVKKPETEVKKPEVEEKKPEVEVKKPETEEKKIEVKEKVSVSVQDRINRMYARLQQERGKRIDVQGALDKVKKISEREEEEEAEVTKPAGLTTADAEAIWDRKQKEKNFRESETKVLMRHPDALNEDGTFNLKSEFTKAYIDIGRKNPTLAYMENGPELAEAMVEKQSGIGYKQGKIDEADRARRVDGAHTSSSTVAVSAAEVLKISDVEARIARRMGLTEKEYLVEKEKISKGQRSI